MRVTESRMMTTAAASLGKARQQVSEAQEELSSGIRVSRPSQGVADWVFGEKARARYQQSEDRGDAIGLAKDNLMETDRALDTIGNALSQARALAVQGANATLNASDRQGLVAALQGIRAQALSAANTLGPNGEFLLAGSKGNLTPFDPNTGAYTGDAKERQIEVSEGQRQTVSVPGSTLTSASGVDILATIDALTTALGSNNLSGVQTSINALDTATGQVANVRAQLGGHLSVLQEADGARFAFQESLVRIINRTEESDPVEAASRLAQGANALEAARASSEKLLAMLQR